MQDTLENLNHDVKDAIHGDLTDAAAKMVQAIEYLRQARLRHPTHDLESQVNPIINEMRQVCRKVDAVWEFAHRRLKGDVHADA